MSDVTISSMIGDIEKYKFNPIMIQRTALEALRIASNGGINIVDPTNPFVFCLENTATNTAAFMQQNEASTRRLYPSSAITPDDLYLHMSDKDYIDRFAVPTSATFTIMLSKAELLSKLVLDPVSGISKITIPKNTVFTIADTKFSLQYPIDIRLLSHGGLQIVYIIDEVSPLQILPTNIVEWDQVQDANGVVYLRLNVLATQFDIITSYNDVSASSGFKTDITITDSFYYVRCYLQDINGIYKEIATTHTQQIYDPFIPTAVITVSNKNIRVVIPIVYITTGLVSGKLRIDVYQTKGSLNMLLGNYNLEDFSADWLNIDKIDDTVYTTPIRNFKTVAIYSTTPVSGGRDQLTFEELRLRVIKNAIGAQNLPVTNIQLQTALEDSGYEVVRNIDTITNRVYLATRNLPMPIDSRIITAASASMSFITTSIKESTQCYGVIDNGKSVTFTPDVIYQNINGITRPITKTHFSQIKALSSILICNEITNGGYLFSPFHYVLDTTSKTFEVRPYYLDSPVIESKSFIEENVTTGLQVSVDAGYIIEKTNTGYTLTFTTKSSDNFKDLDDILINVQLGFTYKNNKEKSYLLANFISVDSVTKERVYSFDIVSNFNIDAFDYISLNSFKYNSSESIVKSLLLQDIDIYFSTSANMPNTWIPNQIDKELGIFQLPANSIGITHERMKIRFGYSLKNLWVMSRSIIDSIPYQTYTEDVLKVYSNDVYNTDPNTGSVFTVDANGDLLYPAPIHTKGTPVLDSNGETIIEHKVGELIYDSFNEPMPVNEYSRDMVRNIDILTIEGAYYFATDSIVKTYNRSIVNSLLNWITVDLVKFNSTLLDQTKIYFFPKVTLGDIKVIVLNGIETTIKASQSLKVKLFVSSLVYNNNNLINTLNKITVKSIDKSLNNNVITVSNIEKDLINVYGSDVISVEVSGIGGENNYKAFTIVDPSNRCSIRKRLSLLADNTMVVEEDCTIEYINHSVTI